VTLRFERRPRADATAAGDVLGEHLFLAGPDGRNGLPRLLGSPQPIAERWLTDAPVQAGRHGLIAFRRVDTSAGGWLLGHGQIDIEAAGIDLQAVTRQLYTDLFALLHAHGDLHLLKLWNYLPHINAERDGLEIYRHFNIGRQQAFLDAGQRAFEGAPAACALGHHGGPLRLEFLAGPVAPRPVENPRQVSAYHYPAHYGPRSPTFSRAALVALTPKADTLFISGTASIVGHASLHPGDVMRQTEETLRNLHAVLDAAHARTPARFDLGHMDLTIYLRDPADRAAVQAVLARTLDAASPGLRDALWLHADVCRRELLVEIEAQGSAPR
jgi:enamine deaminase RidA (YjgF/YER057c/UK114 family)